MIETNPDSTAGSDPRRLRALLARANELAAEHRLHSVVVGISGFLGDRLFPEFVDYVGSALRIDDAIFRMTRERAVLLLTDVDLENARAVMERVRGDFCDRFPTAHDPAISLGYFEVDPERGEAALKQVLPGIFEAPARAH